MNIISVGTRKAGYSIKATIKDFLRLESASGIIMIGVAVLAMLAANSAFSDWYNSLLNIPLQIRAGQLNLEKPLLLWINDGLMAIFFLLVGLEVKREVLEGHLSERSQVTLPALAALGGMGLPALIYVALNYNNPVALNGWAIPAATDIAFALGILSLFGQRVSSTLKLFLLAIAIIADLAAIIIIALFYTVDLSLVALAAAVIATIILFILNVACVTRVTPYIVVGAIAWVFVLKSGVHATLAGVAVAFAIPLRAKNEAGYSPLHQLEHALHPWVAYGILPIFAFANAGVTMADIPLAALLAPVPLGVIGGLFLGKQVGVFGFSWLGVRLGLAKLPPYTDWWDIYGVAILCGIGFTMSLFITSLAFEHTGQAYDSTVRLAILLSSLLAGGWGYIFIWYTVRRRASKK